MRSTLLELKSTVASLEVLERAELCTDSLRTLETPDEGAAAEWLTLAEQRMADVHNGQVVGIPAEEVMKSLRRPRL